MMMAGQFLLLSISHRIHAIYANIHHRYPANVRIPYMDPMAYDKERTLMLFQLMDWNRNIEELGSEKNEVRLYHLQHMSQNDININ